MITEQAARDKLIELRDNLHDWEEPNGYLVPTEPDPDERALVRARLTGAIFGLEFALGDSAI